MEKLPSWLRLDNKFDPTVSPGFLIYHWSCQFHKELLSVNTRKEIWSAKCLADEAIGIRSFAVELLFTPFCKNGEMNDAWLLHLCQLIARVGMNYSNQKNIRNLISMVGAEYAGLGNCLTWCICRPGEKFSYYKWLSDRPTITLRAPEKIRKHAKVDVELLLAECKSKSQRRTMRRLAKIASAVEQFKGVAAGIKLPRAAWIIGPSASGKSHVASLFSRLLGLPTYSATVGSWRLQNSRTESCTIGDILKTLEREPAVIIIDEVDKVHINAGDNQNYFKAVLDEIMLLGTCSLHDFHPSAVALRNLQRSWFIYAGAFQALYRAKLGGQAMFIEQVESLTLTYEDIAGAGWLPDELLNRMGWLIECGSPTVDELSAAMLAIEQACGVVVPNAERDGHAKECVLNMRGFRGVENYALRCAQHSIALAAKIRRQSPPSLPPDAGPGNPSWF